MKKIILLIAFLFGQIINATTIAPVELDTLFQEAETVALVEVIEGKVLRNGDKECGAIYKAKVLHSIKGAEEQFYFGHTYGYEIGSRYLAFLSSDEKISLVSSTNSKSLNSESKALEYREKYCTGLRIGKGIMHEGFGMMKMDKASENKFKDSFLINARYVSIPEAVRRVNSDKSDSVWVKKEYLLKYLTELNE